MLVTLENHLLSVEIKTKGAELCSIVRKDCSLEYIWSGDPAIWGKTSPVLFPIVGSLKDNSYIYNGQRYTLSRHGFARDAEFALVEGDASRAVFVLRDSPASLKNYPFHFDLYLKYELDGDSLVVTYEVMNTGPAVLYFSIGGHPAFRVPLVEGISYEDYYLQFETTENAPRWPISADGLIQPLAESFLNHRDRIELSRNLFEKDALVFKHLLSTKVSLRAASNNHGLDFHFNGFPYLGLWAAKGGDFVCIEPWCGIADAVGHDQLLAEKEGIETLPSGQHWRRQWRVSCF